MDGFLKFLLDLAGEVKDLVCDVAFVLCVALLLLR